MTKSRESLCYDDFSPSLLEINTQPIDEKNEERKVFLFPPSYFSEQNETQALRWVDISASKRVRVVITPLGSRRLEFRIFAEQVATEKVYFLMKNNGMSLNKICQSLKSHSRHSYLTVKKISTVLTLDASTLWNSIQASHACSCESTTKISRRKWKDLPDKVLHSRCKNYKILKKSFLLSKKR